MSSFIFEFELLSESLFLCFQNTKRKDKLVWVSCALLELRLGQYKLISSIYVKMKMYFMYAISAV